MNNFTRTCMAAFAITAAGLTASAADLEPVSITPDSGELTPGTVIKVKFAEAIDWTDWNAADDNYIQLVSLDPPADADEYELYMAYDGSTWIEDDTLCIKYINASNLEGTTKWKLLVPAQTVKGKTSGDMNAAINATYEPAAGGDASEFLPVSITPTGLLSNGDYIVITYPFDIEWASSGAYASIKFYGCDDPVNEWDNETNLANFTIEGKVLTIKYKGSMYIKSEVKKIVIPAGALQEVGNADNKSLEYTHVFEEGGAPEEQITLAFTNTDYDAEEVESIKNPLNMTITPATAEYRGTVPGEDDENFTGVGTVKFTGTDSKTATYQVYFLQSKTLGEWLMCAVGMGVTENTPGTYVLTINAGAFAYGDLLSQEFTHTWTIKGGEVEPGDEDIEPQAVLPYGDEVEAPFTSIQIAFPYADGNVAYDGANNPITVVNDATKEPVEIEVSTSGNMVKISMNITEAGSYTLNVPAGVISNNKGKNVEITRTYKVIADESGIQAIYGEDADARYYNMQGVEVANPAAGEVVIRLSNGKAGKVRF